VSISTDGPVATLIIPPVLALADAEECRQSLIVAVASGSGPALVEFAQGPVGTVALQLAIGTASALARAQRHAGFGPNARAALQRMGCEAEE
jgi:hypothetical protein